MSNSDQDLDPDTTVIKQYDQPLPTTLKGTGKAVHVLADGTRRTPSGGTMRVTQVRDDNTTHWVLAYQVYGYGNVPSADDLT